MKRGRDILLRRFLAAALAVPALLFLSGCAHRDERPDPRPAIYTGPKVAVAPMENRSNDISSSDIVRDAFVEGISERGYAVMPVLESDAMLREKLGISYGGQLPATTPEEVCRALGVEGVFYGEVLEFAKVTTGFYNSAAAAASFRLYGKDGVQLWEGKDRQVRQDVVRGNGGNIAGELLARGLGNILLTPLTPIGKRVGGNIARQLPGGLIGADSK